MADAHLPKTLHSGMPGQPFEVESEGNLHTGKPFDV